MIADIIPNKYKILKITTLVATAGQGGHTIKIRFGRMSNDQKSISELISEKELDHQVTQETKTRGGEDKIGPMLRTGNFRMVQRSPSTRQSRSIHT